MATNKSEIKEDILEEATSLPPLAAGAGGSPDNDNPTERQQRYGDAESP